MTSPKSSKSTSQNPLVEEAYQAKVRSGNLKEELESLNANINVLEADLAANKERLRQAREEVKTIAATVNQTWDIVTRTQKNVLDELETAKTQFGYQVKAVQDSLKQLLEPMSVLKAVDAKNWKDMHIPDGGHVSSVNAEVNSQEGE